MGCDVHMILEKFDRNRNIWVGLHSYDSVAFNSVSQLRDATVPDWPWMWSKATTRNYKLFGEICDGVRGESTLGYTERGVPDDVSDLARMKIDNCGIDGHSHSWLYVPEFLAAWGRVHAPVEKQAEEDVKNLAGQIAYVFYTPVVTMVLDETDITPETARDYRIVFFFDN